MISLHVTNYDDVYAKIRWQDGRESFDIWTNIPTPYIQNLSNFHYNDVNYTFFGFVDQVDSAVEEEIRRETLDSGVTDYTSRWKVPPVSLSETEPEYVVIADDTEIVPEKLFEQVEAILVHYLENEDSLRVQYLNNKTMQRAREDYKKANPEKAENSVLIMWPEKNSRYLKTKN